MIILSRNYRAGNNAMRDFTGGHHAPEGDEQLAGEGHDHLRFACTAGPLGPSAEPLGQRAVLLKQQKLCSFPPLSNTRSVPFWMNFVSRFDSSRILGGVAPELIAYVEVILRTPGLAARFRSGPFSDVWLIDARFGGPGPSAKKPPATGDTHPTGVNDRDEPRPSERRLLEPGCRGRGERYDEGSCDRHLRDHRARFRPRPPAPAAAAIASPPVPPPPVPPPPVVTALPASASGQRPVRRPPGQRVDQHAVKLVAPRPGECAQFVDWGSLRCTGWLRLALVKDYDPRRNARPSLHHEGSLEAPDH